MSRTGPIRFTLAVGIFLSLHTVSLAQTSDGGALWASHSLDKVLRSVTAPTGSAESNPVRVSGCRGETVSGQAVLLPDSDLQQVSASISPLKHGESTTTIPADCVRLQWVRYIDVQRNSAGLPLDELVAQAPTSLPDPYWEEAAIAVTAHSAQPLWIEIAVPATAAPGDYLGTISVQTSDISLSLPIELHVWGFEMPTERHLSVINWGVFPGQTYPKIASDDSGEYFSKYREFCEFLVKHRQTDLMGSLDWIERVQDAPGNVTYDTRRLEQHADVAFAAGIRQIHLHAAGEKTAPILDPAGRVEVPERADGPRRLSQLKALEDTIQRRNWQGRFLVAITDEPFIHHEESFSAAVELVHKTAPSVRVIEAVETEYLGNLDIYVPKLSHLNLWYPQFEKARRERGNELWFYTCCHPAGRYPNRFLDQSLLKVRVLHWINYLYDLQGYLHWGLNFYGSDDPYSEDGISKDLPLGDRAIVYPGKDGPLLVVQTSPPEGTPVPAGPRMVNVRGLVAPGATVVLNGEPVPNVRPSGYFSHFCFLGDEGTVRVSVDDQGSKRSVIRTFPLVE